ncbi:hypothetical protein IKF30_02135 [Candidatus Saccharibacteria bacterium]|nr:hypothetical protein [Candidatus Saccharibacteria bacterium]
MNKDVIYVEPEDDITDIILKIEKSKEKIVALVPPKKAGVFRSVVNIKLIAKSGVTSGKKVVLVTADPSIMRLAGAAKIPVTKNLQTAPTIPEVDTEASETTSKEDLIEESDGTVETEEDVEELEGGDKDKEEAEFKDDEEDDDEDEEDKKPKAKAKPAKKNTGKGKGGLIGWIQNHKKLSIACGIGIVLLILFLVWAFVIAPAVTVTVGVRTDQKPFSQNATFVSAQSEEKAEDGVFYLEEKKVESIQEVEFEATGERNKGQKAKGEIKVYAYFPLNIKASTQIAEGETFTISGLTYRATKSETLSYNGEGKAQCGNKDNSEGLVDYGCRINGTVSVEASEPGTKYNIAASSTGWDTNARVIAYSDSAMTGGTDDIITVVQQADILKAKESLASSNEKENKEKLLEEARKDALVIESSFTQSTGEAISTPGEGEEVKKGEKAKLKAVTTATLYVIDKTKVEEFIRKKTEIDSNQKIYEIKDPFVDNFSKSSSGYIGKLKATCLIGPELSVSSIVEMIAGKGIGDAQHLLKDINGVTEVKINGSYPWVMSVPGDSNRITVNLDIKDQSGNKVEQSNKTETDDKAEQSDENK